MKFINKIKSLGKILLISSCVGVASCDFLEIVPPEQATLKDATKDVDHTLRFLLSCYANVWNPLTPSVTDEHAWPAEWGGPHRYVAYGLYTPTNTRDDGRWSDFYRSINQTNLFLRELQNAKKCTEAQIGQWTAEAHFLLAYYHYELLNYFGPIPVMDQYLDTSTSADSFGGRKHYDYVVNWIVKTLDEKVINNQYLPSSRSAEERGRATTVIAKALKARILVYAASPLWNGEFPYPTWNNSVETPEYGTELVSKKIERTKWTRAELACREALTAAKLEGYELYEDLNYVTETQKIKDELLPFIPGLENPSSAEGKLFRTRVLMLKNMITLKVREGNTELIWGVAKDAGIQNYTMPRKIIQNNNQSWFSGASAIGATLYSVEHFYTKEGDLPEHAAGVNGFPAKNEWLKSAGIANRADIIKINSHREPRYYAWMAFDGGDYGTQLSNGKPLLLKLRSSNDQGYTMSDQMNYNPTGFMNQKWIRVDQSRSPNNQWNNNDVNQFARPIIRMAELYLNLAECQAALDNKDALSTINDIRKRAGIRNLSDADLSKMSLMDWVRNERFVELWGEGHRWNDVRRWCAGADFFGEGKREGLNARKENPSFETFNTRTVIDQPYRWYKRMYLAPIQYDETQRNKQLVQAPGY